MLMTLSAMSLAAQFSFDRHCREAYIDIQSLRFEMAEAQIRAGHEAFPENVMPVVLDNYIDFLKLFISEDQQLFETLKANKDHRIDVISAAKSNSPYKKWALATVNLQWAFARIKFGEYYTAVFEIRRAFLLLEENEAQFPGFIPNKIGLGLLYSLVGSIPSNYQWVVHLTSMHGTVDEGASLLYQAKALCEQSDEFRVFLPESLFFLTFVEMNLKPDKSGAKKLLGHFSDKDSTNLLLVFAKSDLLMHTGQNDQAMKLLQNRPKGKAYYPFYYLDYLLAETQLRKLDPRAAENYSLFLAKFSGKNYRLDARRKLAWLSLISGDEAAYFRQMRLIDVSADPQIDADKQAIREREKNQAPGLELLKARLLFDGGYMKEALELLTAKPGPKLSSVSDSVEFHYRLGRIYHETGEFAKADTQYENAIRLGAVRPEYYAANAALKLGEIAESQGNTDKALFNYRRCLAMNPGEYRNSMHAKAKAGINRLEE